MIHVALMHLPAAAAVRLRRPADRPPAEAGRLEAGRRRDRRQPPGRERPSPCRRAAAVRADSRPRGVLVSPATATAPARAPRHAPTRPRTSPSVRRAPARPDLYVVPPTTPPTRRTASRGRLGIIAVGLVFVVLRHRRPADGARPGPDAPRRPPAADLRQAGRVPAAPAGGGRPRLARPTSSRRPRPWAWSPPRTA